MEWGCFDVMEQTRRYRAGNGTKEQPYEIWNEEEFIYFSFQCMKETEYYYYVLRNDLDLSGYLWKPIGVWESQLDNREWRRGFYGSFDGAMHQIKGIKLQVETEKNELCCMGLFAMIGACQPPDDKQPQARNLQVQYDSQSCVLTAENTYYGGITGILYNGKIEHCLVTLNMIFVGEHVGLFAGGVAGIMRTPIVSGKRDSARIQDTGFSGSMIATVKGQETPKVYLGGIAGSMQTDHCVVKHCISRSFLHGSFTGKIAGSVLGGSIID